MDLWHYINAGVSFTMAATVYGTYILAVRKGFKRGYKQGATDVLNEWKQYMKTEDEEL